MIEETSTLQDFPLQASIQAVKASADFESYDDFYRYLLDHLPQNSPQTRRRYAELIGKRYFPGLTLDSLLPHIWKAYQDERILVDLMRVYALEAEPVMNRACWPTHSATWKKLVHGTSARWTLIGLWARNHTSLHR